MKEEEGKRQHDNWITSVLYGLSWISIFESNMARTAIKLIKKCFSLPLFNIIEIV